MPGETDETLKNKGWGKYAGSSSSGVPPGETHGQGTVNTNPADDWIGSSQDTSVYYGNLPQSQGNVNVNVSNPLGGNYVGPPPPPENPMTSDDPLTSFVVNNTTGSGATGGEDKTGSAYFTPNYDLIGGGIKYGVDNFYDFFRLQNEATAGQYTNQYIDKLLANEPAEANLFPNIPKNNTGWKDEFNVDVGDYGKVGLTADMGLGYTSPSGDVQIGYDPFKNFIGGQWKYGNAQGGPISKYDEGGPVGGPEIDQSGIASLYPEMAESPREPFGATRENVGEQLEAWRNAPHHVDPPNIGFMGEQIPAPLFDKAMKYLDSLPPSERAVIEEMFRKNIMRKRMEEAQKMQESQSIPTLDV